MVKIAMHRTRQLILIFVRNRLCYQLVLVTMKTRLSYILNSSENSFRSGMRCKDKTDETTKDNASNNTNDDGDPFDGKGKDLSR
jgi:hypothetical protein